VRPVHVARGIRVSKRRELFEAWQHLGDDMKRRLGCYVQNDLSEATDEQLTEMRASLRTEAAFLASKFIELVKRSDELMESRMGTRRYTKPEE